ncbi:PHOSPHOLIPID HYDROPEROXIDE GLUTATHIONE PEROXIDASE [Salix koriyanagi]|uniref:PHOSPHOLIPID HYDROPEROXIDE GLUTATHIONE PEROXIDASE n=1 Tax=Salix koriyanagi TaxID=2511006 RepID=A0A9Q0T5K4_9ROSI|nr:PHOSPHOLIPID HYDROPEROXIDE GLUTATHIONE PEROXIDASE [Salix koriyanagi]
MRFLKRIAGFLGLAKDDGGYEVKDQQQAEAEAEEQDGHQHPNHVRFRSNFQETGLPRKGFGVPVQVVVERPQLGPVIVPCISGDGGLQVRSFSRLHIFACFV